MCQFFVERLPLVDFEPVVDGEGPLAAEQFRGRIRKAADALEGSAQQLPDIASGGGFDDGEVHQGSPCVESGPSREVVALRAQDVFDEGPLHGHLPVGAEKAHDVGPKSPSLEAVELFFGAVEFVLVYALGGDERDVEVGKAQLPGVLRSHAEALEEHPPLESLPSRRGRRRFDCASWGIYGILCIRGRYGFDVLAERAQAPKIGHFHIRRLAAPFAAYGFVAQLPFFLRLCVPRLDPQGGLEGEGGKGVDDEGAHQGRWHGHLSSFHGYFLYNTASILSALT